MYTDIAKAFDSVSHLKLLLKVEAYGFKSDLKRLHTMCIYKKRCIPSYISCHEWCTSRFCSWPFIVFDIYINDLPDNVVSPAGIKIFADGTKLYLAYVNNETSPLTQSLQTFCSWSQTWQLSVAYNKCSVISFGSQSDLPFTPYSLTGIPLQSVSSIRDLGVCLTSDLKPSTHCSSVAAMAFNRSSLLLKTFCSVCPCASLQSVCTSSSGK